MSKNTENQPIKCKNCPLYTGIVCHGHGDYWGDCKELDIAYKMLKTMYKDKAIINYKKEYLNFYDNDSNCIFLTKDNIDEY